MASDSQHLQLLNDPATYGRRDGTSDCPAVVYQTQSSSGRTISLLVRLVLSWPSIYGRRRCSTTFTAIITASLGLGTISVNFALWDVEDPSRYHLEQLDSLMDKAWRNWDA